jgi:hypothetical protein
MPKAEAKKWKDKLISRKKKHRDSDSANTDGNETEVEHNREREKRRKSSKSKAHHSHKTATATDHGHKSVKDHGHGHGHGDGGKAKSVAGMLVRPSACAVYPASSFVCLSVYQSMRQVCVSVMCVCLTIHSPPIPLPISLSRPSYTQSASTKSYYLVYILYLIQPILILLLLIFPTYVSFSPYLTPPPLTLFLPSSYPPLFPYPLPCRTRVILSMLVLGQSVYV